MKNNLVTIIIITKNEQDMIVDCLKSASNEFSKIVVLDSGSTDKTIELARKYTNEVFSTKGDGFSEYRNDAIKYCQTPWFLFLDADERLTPEVNKEVTAAINNTKYSAYDIPRCNIYLGKKMKHGGWGNDLVTRLFRKVDFISYEGKLHEQPVFKGSKGRLNNHIIHHSHRDLDSMVKKTIHYTKHEAELITESNHPSIRSWRIFRMILTELYYRLITKRAYMDGLEGIIDSIFQSYNTFIIYSRVWEYQQKVR